MRSGRITRLVPVWLIRISLGLKRMRGIGVGSGKEAKGGREIRYRM